MPYEQILYEQTGRMVVITLNRPDSLNATASVMNQELQDAFRFAMTKEGFHRALASTLTEAEAWEYGHANPTLRNGSEYREGVAAFMEKRPPHFHRE